MPRLACCLTILLVAQAVPATGQVIINAPEDIVTFIPCQMPVWPNNIVIRYRMANARSGGREGTFRLIYKASHANEGPVGAPHRARFLSRDVDVQEEFADMGVWIMRAEFGRNRWVGECARRSNGFNVLYGVDILGRLQQIESPDGCMVETRDPAYDPYDPNGGSGGSCGSNDGGGGGGSSGSGTQYSEGDYTGGELVDWNTGVGIGGTSECGARAQVDYVCFDYWDGTRWVEWTCGYATTC